MTHIDDLIAEAREYAAANEGKRFGALFAELADALERAEAEVERLREALDDEEVKSVVAEAERDRYRRAVDAVRALADRDDLTYVRTDDPISGKGAALRSRKSVADMIRAALDEHLGKP